MPAVDASQVARALWPKGRSWETRHLALVPILNLAIFFFFPVNLFFKEEGLVSLNMGRKRRELVLFSWVFAGLMALAVSGPTPQEARWIAWNKMGSDP